MSVRINLSYQEDWEAENVLELLKPILPGFKVKQCKESKGLYKRLYLVPRDAERIPSANQKFKSVITRMKEECEAVEPALNRR